MKKLITEDELEGMELLLGKHVQVWCVNYIYTGKLVGVNDRDIKIEGCSVVYQTGELNKAGFEDAQQFLAKHHYVRLAAVESYGVLDD